MPDPRAEHWSHGNLNAPQISYQLYLWEKFNFTGYLIGAMLYGIVTILFVQCMGALLNPVNRTKGGIKWGLVVHTVLMFSLFTIDVGTSLDVQSISYIEKREFPGVRGEVPPGPFGYQEVIYSKAISTVPNIVFQLNQWLADGFLLYRCHVIYSMNYWIIAFPCLMYLAFLAIGIADIYMYSRPGIPSGDVSVFNFTTAYYSISLALNVILTLMIVIRLILHNRDIKNAIGASGATSKSYKAVATMLVESFALYAVALVLFIALEAANSPALLFFAPVLAGVQVIAPFLIILRVANRRALTSEDITSGGGSVGSMRFRSSEGESTGGDETVSDEDPTGSTEANGGAFGRLGDGVGNAIEEVPS